MKYVHLYIDKIEYAIPLANLMRIIDGVILTKIDNKSFNFNSPYGNCTVLAKMDSMIDLLNEQKWELIINALLKGGILKENLPIWK